MSNIIGIDYKNKIYKYLLLLIALVLLVSLAGNISEILSAREKISNVENRVNQLRKENQDLKVAIEEILSLEFVEKRARDSLGLAKEGEIVLVLPDEEVLKLLGPKLEPDEQEFLPDPNWKKWLKLFL